MVLENGYKGYKVKNGELVSIGLKTTEGVYRFSSQFCFVQTSVSISHTKYQAFVKK